MFAEDRVKGSQAGKRTLSPSAEDIWTDALNAAKRQKQAVGPFALSMTDKSFNGKMAVPALLLMATAQCAERAG